MWLLLNGERREVVAGVSLAQLIETLNLAPERIAIELNQSVVRRAEWAATELKENDRLEVVHFVGGGATDCRLPIGDCPLVFSRDPIEDRQLRNGNVGSLSQRYRGRYSTRALAGRYGSGSDRFHRVNALDRGFDS